MSGYFHKVLTRALSADADYQAFVARLAEATAKLPSAEAQLAAQEEAAGQAAQDASSKKPPKVVTPLMQHIINRHEQRLNGRSGRVASSRAPDLQSDTARQVSNADLVACKIASPSYHDCAQQAGQTCCALC